MESAGDEEAIHSSQLLPFELVVLEVALGEVCSSIIEAAKELEAKTLPALDALLKKVPHHPLLCLPDVPGSMNMICCCHNIMTIAYNSHRTNHRTNQVKEQIIGHDNNRCVSKHVVAYGYRYANVATLPSHHHHHHPHHYYHY